jgi:Na+/H+ antiporter NhaC
MTRRVLLSLCGLVLAALPAAAPAVAQPTVDVPQVVLRGVDFSVTATDVEAPESAEVAVRVNGERVPMTYQADAETWTADAVQASASGPVTVQLVRSGTVVAEASTRAIPGWWSVLPPLLAIALALAFRRVVPALFLGIWVGAWIAIGGVAGGLGLGLLEAFQVYVLNALANPDHAAIILFSLMIGGMVGIISKNGGTYGIVDRLTTWANTSRRGQVATWAMGLAIFFDDYANTLVVGNTMRPVTDRLRISREKLAYIVDSTAAPVSCIAFVTTWIGYQVGLVDTAVKQIAGFNEAAYSIFLNSIAYSFYPLLALFFVFVVAVTRYDFGPMYRAEKRARTTGAVLGEDAKVDDAAAEGEEMTPGEGTPRRALNAIVPVVVLVGGVLVSLYVTGAEAAGYDAPLRDIIGEAASYDALMWGSLLGVLAAAVLSIGQGILSLEETVEAWYAGLKSMLFAMVILVLAWGLSGVTETLHTAGFLVSLLGDALPAGVVPALVFVLAAATAFATGSSWGTMAILMPLIVPLAWGVLQANGMADPAHYHVIYSSVSCVLAGAVWGDHCSPISDTTILSSMASGCDHIEHVRTQLPYALSVGLVALLLGTLPAGFGMPWWIGLLAGAVLLPTLLYTFGTPVDVAKPDQPDPSTPEAEPAAGAASA